MSKTFAPMTQIVPVGQLGEAKVEHFDVSASESMMTMMRNEYVPEGRYARLFVGGTLMMSDTPLEHRTNYEVVRHAHGRVLVAGLGLGMILVPILAKENVTEVVVVELSADVVAMIAPLYPSNKLRVVTANIFDWNPAKGEKFNTIYFDIWADQSTDDLEEMERLHRKFAPRLDRTDADRWMNSWNRDQLKYQKRRDKNAWWNR